MSKRPGVIVVSENGSDSNWLGTTRSLGSKGIPVIRLSPKGWYPSKYCSTIISPRVAVEPDRYLEFLIRLGKKLIKKHGEKQVLLPSCDNALILISKSKDTLKKYYEPVAPNWSTTEKIVDKSKTYSFADKLGIPVPETFHLNDANEITQIAKTVRYPCLIKPAHSHIFSAEFKTKLLEVNSRDVLTKKCGELLAQGHKLLVQEKIPGKDDQIYTFGTCLNEDSEPLAVFTQRKLRQYPPHYGIGSFGESVWEPKIVDMGRYLLKEMGFYGIGAVEFKKDYRTGEFKLIEINGRSDTRMYLATVCGLNIPYIFYKDITGEKQKPLDNFSCQFELGVKWMHIAIDLLSMMIKQKEGEITLAKWLRSVLVGKKTFGILSLSDLRPFLSEILQARNNVRNLSSFLRDRNTP